MLDRMLDRLLFGKEEAVSRRAYGWNLVSSLLFSLQSALFLLIVTRIGGADTAGGFVILYTVAQTLNAVGTWNLREYQVSDLREVFSFPAYYTARWITCLLMMIAAAGYGILRGVDSEGFFVLLCLTGYRLVEDLEDVYHGAVQRAGRFDAVSLAMSLRIGVSSLCFCAAYAVSRSLRWASAALLISCLLCWLLLRRPLCRRFPALRPGLSLVPVPKLLWQGFPIFAGLFLYSYLINAPRYSLDALMPREAQTVFGVLFMPVFSINLLSAFLYRPKLVALTEAWNRGDGPAFRRAVGLQLILVAGITGAIALFGVTLGWRLLEWLYGVSLAKWRGTFGLLLAFGGVTAAAFYLNTLLTVMRRQGFILAGYLLALGVHAGATAPLIRARGIHGAALAYGAIMGALLIFDTLAVGIRMRKKFGGEKGGGDHENPGRHSGL
ncbi:MAG: hypothetical protein E7325_05150 [Clostridiales bacterium]|nr:hypothetical protein [Clostridiales bacterium]